MKNFAGPIIIISAAIHLILCSHQALAYKDGDFQIWHTENQDIRLKDGVKLIFDEEFRYGDNAGELYYHHYDAGLFYNANKNLTTSINYRQIYEGERGKFNPEYEPYINIIPKCEVNGFKIEDRNRFELRLYDDKRDNKIEYRNKISLIFPWNFLFAGSNIEPYVSDEIFVWMGNIAFRRNRFSAGVTFTICKGLKGDVYYMLQSTKKSARWTEANILGIKLKVSF